MIVAFHCCSPSIHDDVREFFGDFWVGRKRGSILYSPNYSKICILRLCQPVLSSLSTRGYINPKKISLVAKKSCTRHNTEGVLNYLYHALLCCIYYEFGVQVFVYFLGVEYIIKQTVIGAGWDTAWGRMSDAQDRSIAQLGPGDTYASLV